MTNNLPPGPWSSSATGTICDATGYTIGHVYGRGDTSGSRQAISELLIRAEREADETRLTIEDVERMLGKECEDDMDTVDVANISFEASSDGIEVWRFNSSSADHVATIKTHGEFRTFCRLFGIEVGA